MPGADRGGERLDLGVGDHLVHRGALDVEDLAAQREDRLRPRIARVACGAAGGVALDDEQLGVVAVAGRAVGELVGHAHAVERGLAARQLARLLRRAAGARRVRRLADDRLRRVRVLLEPAAEVLVRGALHERAHLGVAELGLGLALELRIGEPHRHDRGEPLAHVVALERRVLRLQQVARLGVTVDRLRERALEALGVHPAFGGGDAVRVAVQALRGSRCSTATRPRPRLRDRCR